MADDYFRSTLWDDIDRARKDDPQAREMLFQRYLPPVMRFLRKLGFNEHDSDDLAQEVFLRIVEKDVLGGADARLGRFRSLLIGIIKNVIRDRAKHDGAKKRGGDKAQVSLDQKVGSGSTVLGETLPEKEAQAFEQFWTFHLVRMAMERLRKECEEKKLPYHEAFAAFLAASFYTERYVFSWERTTAIAGAASALAVLATLFTLGLTRERLARCGVRPWQPGDVALIPAVAAFGAGAGVTLCFEVGLEWPALLPGPDLVPVVPVALGAGTVGSLIYLDRRLRASDARIPATREAPEGGAP